jgi:hypothetical protein
VLGFKKSNKVIPMPPFHTTINHLASEYGLDKIIGVCAINKGLYFLTIEDVIARYSSILDDYVVFDVIEGKLIISIVRP